MYNYVDDFAKHMVYTWFWITTLIVILTLICRIKQKNKRQPGRIMIADTEAASNPSQSAMSHSIMEQSIEAGVFVTTSLMLHPNPGAYPPNMTPYPSAAASPSTPPPSYSEVISSAYYAPIPKTSAPLREMRPDIIQTFWAESSEGSIPPNAILAGYDDEKMYIGRAYHGQALIPGKILPSHICCYISWRGKVYKKWQYQVLCGKSVKWIWVKGDNFPDTAILGGSTATGEPLYIGRVPYKKTWTVGRVQTSHKFCYIPFDEKEIAFGKYQILVDSASEASNRKNIFSFRWDDDITLTFSMFDHGNMGGQNKNESAYSRADCSDHDCEIRLRDAFMI